MTVYVRILILDLYFQDLCLANLTQPGSDLGFVKPSRQLDEGGKCMVGSIKGKLNIL